MEFIVSRLIKNAAKGYTCTLVPYSRTVHVSLYRTVWQDMYPCTVLKDWTCTLVQDCMAGHVSVYSILGTVPNTLTGTNVFYRQLFFTFEISFLCKNKLLKV